MRNKALVLGSILPVVLILDRISKVWAEAELSQRSMEILGGLLPLTLAYNKGAAFGMRVGEDSRWLFIPITFVALGLMGVLYRQARSDDGVRLVSLALVMAGALGNLYDRIFIREGVVDFLGPLDLGFWHFPIFNFADISITCGAILLAISFWQEERAERAAEKAAEAAASETVAGPEAGEPAPSADTGA